MYSLRYKEQYPEIVGQELDELLAALKGFLAAAHNDDGTLRTDAIETPIEERWSTGPWVIGSPGQASTTAPAIAVTLATGTYNNVTPDGMSTAVIVTVTPTGGTVTLNGLAAALAGGDDRRLYLLQNGSTTQSLALAHEQTASLEQNRFSTPGGVTYTIGPNSAVWVQFDPTVKRNRVVGG